jgi:hypothetical protein
MAEPSTITREMIEAAAERSQPISGAEAQSLRNDMQNAKKHANDREHALIKLSLPASIAINSHLRATPSIKNIKALALISAQRNFVIARFQPYYISAGITLKAALKSIQADQVADKCCICAALATGGARG